MLIRSRMHMHLRLGDQVDLPTIPSMMSRIIAVELAATCTGSRCSHTSVASG
jgi:hypothetical protein